MTEEEKPRTFEQTWKDASQWGEDVKGYAKIVFEEGKKLNWPQELIDSIIGICVEIHNFHTYYQETFASKDEDIKPLKRKLAEHKHLPDGQAVEPL